MKIIIAIIFLGSSLFFDYMSKANAGVPFSEIADLSLGLNLKRFPFDFLGETYTTDVPFEIMLNYKQSDLEIRKSH